MATIKCSQCEKPAIGIVAGHPLCVDCNLKFQQVERMREASIASYMNFLLDQMDSIVGLPPTSPRYEVPQPIIHQGTMNFQNIKVDKNIIGVLNFGEIERLDMAMSVISNTGNNELKEAIKEFTEAVMAVKEADKELRNELIEQVAFLSTQAALSKEKSKPSVVKSVLRSIKETLTSTASLVTLMNSWNKLAPLFEQVFGG